jgi:hypothetical protein
MEMDEGHPDWEVPCFLFASLMLSAALGAAPLTESAALDSPHRHVRSQDRSIRYLLKRGFKHSPTFAHLMARLERKRRDRLHREEPDGCRERLEGRHDAC